jgi:hypothetical protein
MLTTSDEITGATLTTVVFVPEPNPTPPAICVNKDEENETTDAMTPAEPLPLFVNEEADILKD